MDVWSIVIGIAGVVATISSILVVILRGRKQLSYEVLPSIPVVQLDANKAAMGKDWDHLELVFQGRSVNDAHLVRVRIWNSGSVEIRPQDFYSPITLRFGGDLLQVGILETAPPKLMDILNQNGYGGGSGNGKGSATFDKFLINQGYSVTVKLLVANFAGNGSVTVDADIAGVPNVRRVDRSQLSRIEVVFASGALMLGAIVIALASIAGVRLSWAVGPTYALAGVFIGLAGGILAPFLAARRTTQPPR